MKLLSKCLQRIAIFIRVSALCTLGVMFCESRMALHQPRVVTVAQVCMYTMLLIRSLGIFVLPTMPQFTQLYK